MRVSMSDVARHANVSMSTVSRVINGLEIVKPETRKRVEEAIEHLRYQPSGLARGLMRGRSELIGLVLPDLHGEFYSEIIRGADAEARELGYGLVISSIHKVGEDAPGPAIQHRGLLDGMALMVSELTSGIRRTLADMPVPFVLLDHDLPGAPHDSVIIDQHHAVRKLMQHVIGNCGARRVIFLGGAEANVDTRARFGACREALQQAGLPLDPEDVYYLDFDYRTAFNLATRVIDRWASRNAFVFAANDEMAAGVIAAASHAGVRIPDDLGVVGFDDTRIAQLTHPALTTVRVPMALMGAESVRLLCQRLHDRSTRPARVVLQPEVVVRASCGSKP